MATVNTANVSEGSLFDLTGKVAIITGSSRGIGRAIAERFAQQGAKVVISSRKPAPCDAVASLINQRHPGHAVAVPATLSSKESLQHLVDETMRTFGRIDILVCNAAVNPYHGSQLDIPDEAFRKVLESNILANNWLIKMVTPQMRARKDGAIIIVSSNGGLHGSEVIGAYCISKAGDMQMARNLARELSPSNIRVNCIAPGLVKTDFSRAIWESPENEQYATRVVALRRLGEPDDIAGAAIYLASRAGAWTTGQTIVVDGGTLC